MIAGMIAAALLAEAERLAEADRLMEEERELEGFGDEDGVAEKVLLVAVSPKLTMITPPLLKRTCKTRQASGALSTKTPSFQPEHAGSQAEWLHGARIPRASPHGTSTHVQLHIHMCNHAPVLPGAPIMCIHAATHYSAKTTHLDGGRGGDEVGCRLHHQVELRGGEVLLDVEHSLGIRDPRGDLYTNRIGLAVLVRELKPGKG
jgi:hypothetical protein